MQVTELEYKQGLIIVENFQNQVSDLIQYFEVLSEDDRNEFSKTMINIQFEERIQELIVARKMQIKNRNPIKITQYFPNDESKTNKG